MWSTRSPASVVRCMLGKHRGEAWRRELKNTGMHATRGTQGNLPLQLEHQWDPQHQVNWEGTRVLARVHKN